MRALTIVDGQLVVTERPDPEPAAGDVLFTVGADAARPMSGGTAICTPSSLTTSTDTNGMPLKVIAGTTTTAKELDSLVARSCRADVALKMR